MQSLINIENVSVTRAGRVLAGPLSLRIERGEHIAVTGANGSGKTTLLRLLRGEYLPDSGGKRVYDFGDGPQHSVLGLRQRIALVSADQQDFYLLHAARAEGRSVVLSGFFDTPLLYEKASAEQEAAADAIIDLLGIEGLVRSEMGALSTGQVRKLLIARALVTRPDVLLLDECLEGLDAVSRIEILALLEKAGELSTLVCAVHRVDDMPECVEQVVVLEGGRIVSEASRDEGLDSLREIVPEVFACDLPPRVETGNFDYILRMENVSVVVDGTRILHSMDWEVLPGENWVVVGENGAGKSTLLKLVTSELAPYADDGGAGKISRLGGMTMDEARPLIGVVSPALQASYARELGWEVTALETVLSGYRGSVGMLDEPTSEELLGAQEWLELVGLGQFGERMLRRMSYGQQRRVFLARAMAGQPELLLLDEPLSGLDTVSRMMMREIMQKLAEGGTPMILVTHHVEDWIPAMNRVLYLEEGQRKFVGNRDEFAVLQEKSTG